MSEPEAPYKNYYFALSIDGFGDVAHFNEVSGIKTTSEVYELEEGGYNGSSRKLYGRAKFENIVLKQGVTSNMALVEWRDQVLQGEDPRRNGSIVLRANDHTEVRRFTFINAWPVSWEGPSLNSGGSDLMVETLELAIEGIVVDGDSPPPPPPPPPPNPEPPPNVIVTDDEIITEPIQFDLDEATLTDDGQRVCDDLNDTIAAHPEIEDIWVEGHTCDLGPGGAGSASSASYNRSLSARRAATVMNELKSKNPDRNYMSAGYGFDHPVAPNNSDGNRARNRRTQIWQTPRAGKRDGELEYKKY